MFDAKNVTSDKVDFILNEVNGGYELTVKPDNEWVNGEERSWPLTIDPPIETSLDQNKIQDSYVDSYQPGNNNGGKFVFCVGHASWGEGKYGFQRSFVKFDLPTLTSAYKIEGAFLESALQETNTASNRIDAYAVDGGWSEDGLTWNNMPGCSSMLSSVYVGGNRLSRFQWDITSLAKDWYAGKKANNGVMLKNYDENNGYNVFYSKNTTEAYPTSELVRPLARIHYSYKDNIKQYLGRVEAESFTSKTGNVSAKLSDGQISGGHYVENIQNESDSFTLNVNSRRSGIYEAQFMFMAASSGQIAEVITNEGSLDQDKKNVELVYENNQWKLSKIKIKLHKGLNTVKVKAYKGVGWKMDYVDFVHKLPDTVEGENFDNFSGILAVDDDNKQERRVGHQDAGDWYDYKVDVEKAGLYRFVFNVSSESTSGSFLLKDQKGNKIQMKDENGTVLDNINVPNTSSYDDFKPVSCDIYLTKDITKLKFEVTGGAWDLNSYECHYVGARRFQAEEFYDGSGTMDFIDQNGSQYVGCIDEGDFTSYKVILRNDGVYNLNMKVSAIATDGIIRVENENYEVLERFNIPKTGGYDKWTEINKNIKLHAGNNIIRLKREIGTLII
jgi:hypothetical protein